MSHHDTKKPGNPPLRTIAETQLEHHPAPAAEQRPTAELLHELQVYQTELEMQNEALRQAQIALEESRDRYADLYEFAPVGYLTLTAHGMIEQINLTGATLIRVDRPQLLQRGFSMFVSAEDRHRWMTHFLNIKKGTARDAIELRMRRGADSFFDARLDCMAVSDEQKVGAGKTAIRVTLTDISDRALAKQNERNFRAVFERSPIGIGIAGADLRYRMVNPAFCRMLGYSEAELIGMSVADVTHPDDVELNLEKIDGLTGNEASQFFMEKRYVRKDGEIVWTLLNVVAVNGGSGQEPYTIGLAEDITARRRTEIERLDSTRQQRDTLVREVHHRIKNNLQSVAGLLQRELGQFVELDPRLETAISQVSTIAVVHGLQSANPDEAVCLCDSIGSICKAVSDLSQRPVLFNSEHEQTAFRPVRVENSEAVSIALVLNELILNAVKHSPPGSPAPTVSLSTDGSSARVVIRNTMKGRPEFDIDSGAGLGTGLRLVRSLLPDQGVHLTFEPDPTGLMLTRLKLDAPVVAAPEHRPRSFV